MTAGYSGTPLARKIGIKHGHRVHLHHRPPGWTIPDAPDTSTVVDVGATDADITVAFYRSVDDLAAEAPALVHALADRSVLWIGWPRRAAGHVSDITENSLREILLPLGVVDVKVAALGDDWSGLKFVRRKENRRN